MQMNAGKLDQRITIVRANKTTDSDGYIGKDDQPVRTCWAGFSRTSGKELTKNNADYGAVTARFLIRYTKTPIDRKMVVLYRGQRYPIEYVNNYGDQNQYIELICSIETPGRVSHDNQ